MAVQALKRVTRTSGSSTSWVGTSARFELRYDSPILATKVMAAVVILMFRSSRDCLWSTGIVSEGALNQALERCNVHLSHEDMELVKDGLRETKHQPGVNYHTLLKTLHEKSCA